MTTTQPKKIWKAKLLEPSPFSRCNVDIIIPFHGEYERVTRLVEGILSAVRSNKYRITLVDDASPGHEFVRYFEKHKDEVMKDMVHVVRSETPIGFGGALELGFRNTEQPYLLFMHSDCSIEDPTWMLRMGDCLLKLKDKKVRLVSARTNNPGEGMDPRLKAERSAVERDVVVEDGFLPLYCAMCHRDLFKHIGGFIKSYPYAMYEDVELAHRMRHYGFLQGICGNAWVRHDAGATISSIIKKNPGAKDVMESNYEKCVADLRLLPKK